LVITPLSFNRKWFLWP